MRRIFWKVKSIIVIGSVSNFGVPVTLFLASRNYLLCGLCVWRVAPSSGLVGFQDKHSKVSLSPSDVYTKSHSQWTLVWMDAFSTGPTCVWRWQGWICCCLLSFSWLSVAETCVVKELELVHKIGEILNIDQAGITQEGGVIILLTWR